MLVSYLRTDAAILLQQATIHPSTPSAAWRALANTRWAQRFDPVAFGETPDLDQKSRFDAPLFALDPEKTRQELEQQAERKKASNDWIRRYWADQAPDAT